MLSVYSRVASCDIAAIDVFFDRTVLCAASSDRKFVIVPTQKFSRRCRLRWLDSRGMDGQGGRSRGGTERWADLRSCRALPASADVEESDVDGTRQRGFEFEPGHDPALLLGDSEATEYGEWKNLGRDRRVESLSTSSRSKPAVLGRIGTEVETLERVGRPPGEEGSTGGRESNADERNNGNGIVSGREIDATGDEDGVSSARDGVSEQLPAGQEMMKPGILNVRKPSEPRPYMTRRIRTARRREPPAKQTEVEYYVPKVGDEVIGVVVSGNDYKLDIDVGSEQLGRMLPKDVAPGDEFRSDEFFWAMDEEGASLPAAPLSRVRFVDCEESSSTMSPTSPMLPVGSVLSLQVFGVTLSGRPLLSVRKIARRIAWQRVRQIHELGAPFEVQCVAWSSDGLVSKIEGLRALLPLEQFLNRPADAKSLKDLVGEWRDVLITDVDEAAGKLIVSEKRAWSWRNLRIGSLVIGTVQRIFSFGIELSLNGTPLRAMVHISNISHSPILDICSVFSLGEKVKAVVIKSPIPHRISLSTVYLESSRGLILRDKQRVFQEAEEMAARHRSYLCEDENDEYRGEINARSEVEDPCIANQDWLDFGEERGIATLGSPVNKQ